MERKAREINAVLRLGRGEYITQAKAPHCVHCVFCCVYATCTTKAEPVTRAGQTQAQAIAAFYNCVIIWQQKEFHLR